MQRRTLYKTFHIDTQLINSRGKLETMNLIEKWAADGVILVNMSSVSFNEAQADGDPGRTKKALAQIFTMTEADTNDPLYKKIEAALFPKGAQNKNQENDVKIVFEAAKYGAILITDDGASKSQPGGILGNRDKLKGLVPIMSSREAVEFIHKEIQNRDDFNRRYVQEIGGELPEWTGKD
jgi:hypothetical protein